MSTQDQEKWNTKYRQRIKENIDLSPNEHLQQLAPYFQGGHCLDLACGLGANSLFLAKQGYKLTSWDISDVAIRFLQEKAECKQLPITAEVKDLDQLDLPEDEYHLIVNTFFLDRQLFPQIQKALKEEGLFFMETFFATETVSARHIHDAYKLRPGELAQIFKEWEILFFCESEQSGTQTILAKKIMI